MKHEAMPGYSVLPLVLSLCLAAGCALHTISDYDEVTDRAVTALQRKTGKHLATLERHPEPGRCEYERHMDFYEDATVDAAAILVRARALPANALTIGQAELLMRNLALLEERHRMGCIGVDEVAALRLTLNSGFTAMLRLELEKKRGRHGH